MRRVFVFLRRYLPIMLGILVLLAVVVVWWIFPAPLVLWIHSTQSFDAVAFLGGHLLFVAMLGGCLLVLALIWLPKWQAARSDLTTKEQFELENDARKTLAEIVGGAALLVGLYFTWANLQVTQETATKDRETTREGQITERFTKAIEQLGNDKLQIRLGGIYALERIARESPQDHWPIMEVLTAYVRENAPSSKAAPPPQDNSPQRVPSAVQGQQPKLATDIQAVLTVLGRRVRTHEKADQHLHLGETDLRGAHLARAHLEGAFLSEAHLEGAHLARAHLEGAFLGEAHLERAFLARAHLEGADLRGAHLEGASLGEAQIKGATGLTVEQLATVRTLYQAQLDPPLLEQIQRLYPQFLEQPQE